MKQPQFSSAALSCLPAFAILALGVSSAKTGFVVGAQATVPTITCPGALELESTEGAIATLRVNVRDDDGNPLVVVWTVDGTSYQMNSVPGGVSSVITSEGFPTNYVPPTGVGSGFEEWRSLPGIPPALPPTVASVDFTAIYGLGEHDVVVSVSDGATSPVTCSTKVTVRDTTPPQIHSIVATPNVLWVPNHQMVPVRLIVSATDNAGQAWARIKSVACNDPAAARGNAEKSPSWEITGPLSLSLRAARSAKGHGRIYTVTVECVDASGNAATGLVNVYVPQNRYRGTPFSRRKYSD